MRPKAAGPISVPFLRRYCASDGVSLLEKNGRGNVVFHGVYSLWFLAPFDHGSRLRNSRYEDSYYDSPGAEVPKDGSSTYRDKNLIISNCFLSQ